MPDSRTPRPVRPNFLEKTLLSAFSWLLGAKFAISARIDDTYPTQRYNQQPHDRDLATAQKYYMDALEAWRKNPLARRIVAIVSDYVLGDGIFLSSKNRTLNRFIETFWNHPENQLENRLETMCDELTRAGDLFPVLFLEEATGIPLIRFIPKDSLTDIKTAPNDWETELEYIQPQTTGDKAWKSPKHPNAGTEVMLHYKINGIIGALTGEGDLDVIIPWLQRYSRMLEDRVRLHWATRVFLWFVKVPTNKVQAKQQQYASPPAEGSVIVHDELEEWDIKTPNLQARDAKSDMDAVKTMLKAGNGFPGHWLAESGTSNLAEAKAMQAAPERHLKRRQNYFVWMLCDLTWQAYEMAQKSGKWPQLTPRPYTQLFTIQQPDISRTDNAELATAGKDLATALQTAAAQLPGQSKTFAGRVLDLLHKFIGEDLPAEEKEKILNEAFDPKNKPEQPTAQPAQQQQSRILHDYAPNPLNGFHK